MNNAGIAKAGLLAVALVGAAAVALGARAMSHHHGPHDLVVASADGTTASVDAAAVARIAAEAPEMHVFKTATCGCCSLWIDHMREAGFNVVAEDVMDIVAVKRMSGVDPDLHSCHTALIDGYVVEGHVPAGVVAQLLADRPDIAGIAVPGMPMGSPGMEGPNPQPYSVVAFTKDGGRSVYASVPAQR